MLRLKRSKSNQSNSSSSSSKKKTKKIRENHNVTFKLAGVDVGSNIPTIRRQSLRATRKQRTGPSVTVTALELHKENDIIKVLRTMDQFKIMDDTLIKQFANSNHSSGPHLRSINNDFISLLREDEPDIGGSISVDCNKNAEKFGSICYCCGEPVDRTSSNKQCDHLIPIITMLLFISPSKIRQSDMIKNLLSYNLHYIHPGCNSKKRARSINRLWRECGTNVYSNVNGLTKDSKHDKIKICREKLITILNHLPIHSTFDIKQKLDALSRLNILVNNVKEYTKIYFSDITAAEHLLAIKEKKISDKSIKAAIELVSLRQVKSK